MANMNFGVNILPKANNTYSLGNSDYKWNIFANTINGQNVDTFLSAATPKSSGTMSANDKLKLNTVKNDLYYDMDFVDTSFSEFPSQAVLTLQSLLSSNYYIISNLRRTSSSSNLNIESSACYYAETINALPRTDTATSTAPFNKYSYYNIMDVEGELTANKTFYERVSTEAAFDPAVTMKSGDDVTILVYLAGSVTGSSDAPAKFTLTLDYTDSTSETKNIELTKTVGLSTLNFTLSKNVSKLHVTILCRSGYTFAAQLSWAVLVNAEYTELTSTTFFTKEEIGNKDIFLFPHIYTLTYYVGAKEYVDGVTLPATTSYSGLMSAADKTLVDIFSSFRDTVAIREDGNTAAHNLANDTYILWKGNICKTTAAITGGTTISSSNVYNCGTQDGALNILNDQIKSLTSTVNSLSVVTASENGLVNKDWYSPIQRMLSFFGTYGQIKYSNSSMLDAQDKIGGIILEQSSNTINGTYALFNITGNSNLLDSRSDYEIYGMSSIVGQNNKLLGWMQSVVGGSIRSIGLRNFASGDSNCLIGKSNNVSGIDNVCSGEGNLMSGIGNIVYGACTHVFGQYNNTTANDTLLSTASNLNSGTYSENTLLYYDYSFSGDSSNTLRFYGVANTDNYSKSGYTPLFNQSHSIYKGNTFLEMVGNGTADNARSNARALDWSGNEYLNGDIYVNCGANSTGGTKLISTTMVGATASVAGSSGYVPAPTTGDVNKFLAGDGTWKSGGLPMVILSYGNSTWNDFINAYNNNVIVYCRASSNSNPASGSQTRMAFMAYVSDATNPTNVEFQYYRSMSSHSSTAMGDEVYVYKLTNANAWSVTTRKASIKEIAVASGSKLGVSWSSDKVTLSNTMTANDMPMSSSDATTAKSAIDTLNSNLSTILIVNDTAETVPSASFKTIATLQISAGTYIATGDIQFSTDTTGIRILVLDFESDASNNTGNSVVATGRATLNKTRLFRISTTSTLYLRAYQTSGSDMNVTGRIRAIKLAN